MTDIEAVATQLVAKPKGILAMDESTGTIEKRLNSVGLESTEDMRRDYREMIVTTPELGNFISGAILFEETLFQKGKDGTLLAKHLENHSIVPGIKVDTGAKDNPQFPGGKITEGLDGLPDRLAKYKEAGAGFTKWRAVLTVADTEENNAVVKENAIRLATYAKMAQAAGLVPIVEPEVLMDGEHDIEACAQKTRQALKETFDYLKEAGVNLKGVLLKPNMVHEGKECSQKNDVATVARMTVEVLKECVPEEVPGIVFLSGGLSDEDSTAYLSEMNKKFGAECPWKLSYSFGRALQSAALKEFGKSQEDTATAQAVLRKRAEECSNATQEE